MPVAFTTTLARSSNVRPRLVVDAPRTPAIVPSRLSSAGDAHVVQHAGAVVGGGLRQRHRQAGVVELPVVVQNGAQQVGGSTLGMRAMVSSRSSRREGARLSWPASRSYSFSPTP